MSDFDGVEFFDNIEEMKIAGPEVAPTGEYNGKIVATEKYKAKSGNWTLKMTFQVDGGSYRDHMEWYNLWSPVENNKRIANEIFTRLTKAVGFKKYPDNHSEFIGKVLRLNLVQFEDEWKNDKGEMMSSPKTKIKYMEPISDDGMSIPKEAIPPF